MRAAACSEGHVLGGLAHNAVIDRYTIEHDLGSGAFGKVYAARDAESGQLVALKQLRRLSPSALAHFKQEFRAVQGLAHPNIVRLDGLLEHESEWLIAMELVEGVDLLRYVKTSDNDPSFDEGRLRGAFRQLAEALSALHEHGILHRDLKPANVCVTAEGRLVLLDFGLVTGVDSDAQSTDNEGTGTAEYMAPEQATAAAALSPAVDWYAFGVCLYEALTGSAPFQADLPLAVMLAKQNKLPQSPSERIGARLPADLEGLCMALLATDPRLRPRVEEVRRVLSDSAFRALSGTLTLGELDTGESFEGREVELGQIATAHARARSEGLRVLLVEGESGIGKSALVAEWLQELKRREPEALVLMSRCYENERSAFKAVDAGMESLARRLNRLTERNELPLLPPHAGLLPRHFPALSSVRSLKKAPLLDVPAEPLAALRAALFALAKLLERIAEQGSVVLVVDDLQWADAESFRLLRTLGEGAQAPRVLVLATIRPEIELSGEVTAELALLGARLPIERLPLAGLAKQPCERLTRSLLADKATAGWLERIMLESKGHPLFVSVLSRYALSHRPSTSEELSLDMALGHKLEGLDADSRALLDLLALAGIPCSLSLLSRALGAEPELVQKRAATLVSGKLLRRLPSQHLACFHDRVRTAALDRLDTTQTRALHQALADAMATEPHCDPGQLALHLEGAAQRAEALAAHHVAGDLALTVLAFGQALHHFGRALALVAGTDAEPSLITDLRIKRGHALARGGKSALAAAQYLEACEHADDLQRIELRVWAAQHLLQSAQVEAGLAAARAVLLDLGVPLPTSQHTALARIVWDRMCLAATGLELREGAHEVSAEERARLDAMWTLAFPVSWVEMLSGASLGTRHLRRSLAAAERTHAARALAQEATFATMQKADSPERPRALFARARALYDADENPALEAFVLFTEGSAATFRFDLRPARDKLMQAEALLRTRCPDEPWLLTNVRATLTATWSNTGEFAAHAEDFERWIAGALERDDRFAVANLETLGFGALRFVRDDQPDRARARVNEVMATWPREPFALTHLGGLVVLWYEAMYRGGDAAFRYLEGEEVRHKRAFLMKTTFGRVLLSALRGNAAFNAYVTLPKGSLASNYLAIARKETRALCVSKVPYARFNAPIMEAQLAVIDGDRERALDRVRLAATEGKRLGAGFWEPSFGYLEGVLEGGDTGREKQAQALLLASAQGWKHPRRGLCWGCPIMDALEGK